MASGEESFVPFFFEDVGGGVFLVDEAWGDKGGFDDKDDNGDGNVSKNMNDSGGDGNEYDDEKILIDCEDDVLNIGDLSLFSPHEIEKYEFANIEVAFNFYYEYGKANGFGIRRGRTLRSRKTLEEYQKEFMCCIAGVREDHGLKMEDRVREPRVETRFECKARFHIHLNKISGGWFCISFEDEHNHDLLGVVHCSMLPSYRKMSDSDSTYKSKWKPYHPAMRVATHLNNCLLPGLGEVVTFKDPTGNIHKISVNVHNGRQWFEDGIHQMMEFHNVHEEVHLNYTYTIQNYFNITIWRPRGEGEIPYPIIPKTDVINISDDEPEDVNIGVGICLWTSVLTKALEGGR
ncbi:FAR1 DNA-binding domain [Sesbania bispinosa]|nr:FAR1 DNA-binding domain [Sesbania bispinosa]